MFVQIQNFNKSRRESLGYFFCLIMGKPRSIPLLNKKVSKLIHLFRATEVTDRRSNMQVDTANL